MLYEHRTSSVHIPHNREGVLEHLHCVLLYSSWQFALQSLLRTDRDWDEVANFIQIHIARCRHIYRLVVLTIILGNKK